MSPIFINDQFTAPEFLATKAFLSATKLSLLMDLSSVRLGDDNFISDSKIIDSNMDFDFISSDEVKNIRVNNINNAIKDIDYLDSVLNSNLDLLSSHRNDLLSIKKLFTD